MKIFFFLLLLALFGCSDKKSQNKSANSVAVKVVAVKSTDDIVGSNYIGIVHPAKSASISSQFPGKLSSIFVSQGDYVEKGSVVAYVESQSVISSYEMAKATLLQAEDGYKRLMQVKSTNSVADIKIVEVETQVAKAKAAYEIASRSIEDCKIKAPFSGIVGEVLVSEGIEVNPFDDILKIYDISSLEIKISVPEKEVGKVDVGDTVSYIIPSLSDSSYIAVFKSKGVVASILSHSYECILTIPDNPLKLMPGMVAKVYFSHHGKSNIVVPASIIRFDDEGKYVWCVKDGRVYKRYVSIGDFYEKGIVINEGLHEGDTIIVEGSHKVSIGTSVKIIK